MRRGGAMRHLMRGAAIAALLVAMGGCGGGRVDEASEPKESEPAAEPAETAEDPAEEASMAEAARASEPRLSVRIVAGGDSRPLAGAEAEAVAEEMAALFGSAKSRLRKMVGDADWEEALRRRDCIEVRYPEAVSLDTEARDPVRVTALLLPIREDGSEPELWARDGDTVYSAFIQFDRARYEALRARFGGR